MVNASAGTSTSDRDEGAFHMGRTLRAALAQLNTTVGDLGGNRELIQGAYAQACDGGAQLVVFPELTLTGYPPEDLLLKASFLEDTESELKRLAGTLGRALAIVGYAAPGPRGPRNAAALVARGRVLHTYAKCTLPNYGVFDEKRYFDAGVDCPVYAWGPWRLAVNICEDIWGNADVALVQARAGANLMVNLSASPYHMGKGHDREELFRAQATRLGIPILYSNLVGGQDELVFDGQSLAAAPDGSLLARAPQFEPHIAMLDLAEPTTSSGLDPTSDTPADSRLRPQHHELQADVVTCLESPDRPSDRGGSAAQPSPQRSTDSGTPKPLLPTVQRTSLGEVSPAMQPDQEAYSALILGLRDYVGKNGFRGVVIGVSGGIDSALTAAIAADALGPDAVVGVSMPSAYSSPETQTDARDLAENLGLQFHEIPIGGLFDGTLAALEPLLAGREPDVTEENIQARLRGLLLMAFSNKLGNLVLATGNKSEVAVGYCTLYGDMVGGYSVLKDVFKTHVYRLAEWRNALDPKPPIPIPTIERPPSAELRPAQKDTDSLPPYEILDPIVKALVEDEKSPREVVTAGFDRPTVDRVFRMIQGNEYKRRQAAPGIKITPRAFGRDRRYPLTNRYRPSEI